MHASFIDCKRKRALAYFNIRTDAIFRRHIINSDNTATAPERAEMRHAV